jgi:hypothetical protein
VVVGRTGSSPAASDFFHRDSAAGEGQDDRPDLSSVPFSVASHIALAVPASCADDVQDISRPLLLAGYSPDQDQTSLVQHPVCLPIPDDDLSSDEHL